MYLNWYQVPLWLEFYPWDSCLNGFMLMRITSLLWWCQLIIILKSGDHPNLLVFCKLQTIEIGRVLPCLSKSIHICGFICIVEKCDSLWIFNKDGLVVYHPGWFYSWKTLPANDHYGSRENHVCGWKRFHTQLITFLVSQTISTILNPPYSHMGIIQIICFVSDTLSNDQKSKFNFSSTYIQGLRASLGQGYYINSDCLLNNTAFFIVLASEWQGLIIRFDFQTYYLIASWFSSGAWSVRHFQNSTFFA